MIKNLLEQDEHQLEENKSGSGEDTAAEPPLADAAGPPYVEVNEAENLLELPEVEFKEPDDSESTLSEAELKSIDSFVQTDGDTTEVSALPESNTPLNEISAETTREAIDSVQGEDSDEHEEINQHDDVSAAEAFNIELSAEAADPSPVVELPAEAKAEKTKSDSGNLLFQSPAVEPESFAETARKSGLAYAAAITLTASIVFMLVIGWFADLLFGSSPWGIVGGIILGSLIGFIQFFRMTAQIFKNKD